ncbi:MAG TPA: TIGR01244 family sulfur transferase [Allosphingosinicella sp.]|jgi:uncharacterized protein (TIGR01244 family)|nr:TIGR01244 family sulfur transferase [Allosphingosinicella sp.]
MAFLELDNKTLVADRQLRPDDIEDAAARGVTTIVNNRPDGEEPGQPSSAEIEAAAGAAGLGYAHIPMPVGGEFSSDKVEAMGEALAQGRVLIFCHSGTRSTYLWALARAREGADAGELIRRAGQAGYNIRPLLPWLEKGRS